VGATPLKAKMYRSFQISCFLMAFCAASRPGVAANTLMKGVLSENGLACKSATMDLLVPLLRKADPKGHKKLEESLRKGDCIQLSSGMPIIIIGKDIHSKLSPNNYLIWYSNGKVYSISENRVVNIEAIAGTSPLTTLPVATAQPITEPSSIERPASADEGTGAPFSYLALAAMIGAAIMALVPIGVFVGRSILGTQKQDPARRERAGAAGSSAKFSFAARTKGAS
jgi:hypothetical protein